MASGGSGPPPQSQVPQQSQTQVVPPQGDIDPISKFRMMLPRLRESLINLIKISAQAFRQNANVDIGSKVSGENSMMMQARFERNLEDLFALCDQMEVNLRLALETGSQILDGARFTPIPMITNKTDSHDGQSQSYLQYQATVRAQITTAKEIHDILKRPEKS